MTTFELVGVGKTYPGKQPVHALRGIDLVIGPGEFVVVEGPSGSGKSTLLNLLALLDAPTTGRYLIDGRDTADLDERERARLRGALFGFVFQGFHLMDHRTVVDNVELGMIYAGVATGPRRRRALAALDRVGLAGTAGRRAGDLSGGQRQRVAIARALTVGAGVIVADEPTGNLDSETSRTVLALLEDLHRSGTTIVLVTHSAEVAGVGPRRVVVRDGLVVSTSRARTGSAPRRGDGGAVRGAADPREHRRRVPLVAVVRDAAASVLSRPRRTAALAASVAIGVALAVTTLGLSASAQAQVSERFDAQLNRAVMLARDVPDPAAGSPHVVDGTALGVSRESVAALGSLAGVEVGALLTRNDSTSLALPGGRSPVAEVFLMGATEDIATAAGLDVRWADDLAVGLRDDEILIGRALSDAIGLGPLSLRPQVLLDGRPFLVRGIVDGGIRVTNIAQAVITTVEAAATMGRATSEEVYLLASAGAAPQVAQQAPLVLRPQAPETFTVTIPPDPATLRGQIEHDVRTVLLVLTGVAVLASVVSLTSTMTMSVLERSRELGMRRAIGAQARDISGLVMSEAAMVGAAGGAAGAVVGVLALLVITVVRRWTPVLDLAAVPLALAVGVGVGAVGGVAASVRARRVQPSEALRG